MHTYDQGFAYDAIGNRLESRSETATNSGGTLTEYFGKLTPSPVAGVNALNQYGQITSNSIASNPINDLDGNATTYAVPAYPSANSVLVWDGENRLVSATVNGVTTTYLYDAFGRRIAAQSGYPSPYVWIYDGWNPIVKYYGPYPYDVYLWGLDLSGTLQGAGGVGGLLAVSWDGFDTFYPTYDGNGNVSEYIATNTSVDAHFEYDAFGNVIESTGLAPYFPFRFSTKQQDDETGLLYYGYRHYDPLTGRWPSRDPVGERGGVNLYCFSENDSIRKVDKLGKWAADFGAGGSITVAVTLGGVTGGIEIGVGKTYMFSSSYGEFDCIQCTASLKLGVGAGEFSAGVGLIGSIGDDTWVGEGSTTSNGAGVNFSPDPAGGLSGGFAKAAPGSGNGGGINAGDPLGVSFGPGVNVYRSKTYAGKVCAKRSCLDPFGLVSSIKAVLRIDECIEMAIKSGNANKWGLPKFDGFE